MAGRVTINLTGDEARLLRKLDRVIAKEAQLRRAVDDTGQASEQSSRRAEDGLRRQGAAARTVGQEVESMALRYASVGAAIGAAKRLVDEFTEAWGRNRDAALDAAGALARFESLGQGGQEDRQFLLGGAQPGLLSAGQASRIGFSARSEGFGNERIRELFQQLNAAQIGGEDAERLAPALIALGPAFGGRSIGQIGNFLSTSAESSPLDTSQFAEQFVKVSGVAGAGVEDKAGAAGLLTAFVRGAGGERNADTATRALRSFLSSRDSSKKVRALLSQAGAEGLRPDEQVLALSEALESGQISREQIAQSFESFTAANLLNVLQSPGILEQIPGDTSGALKALNQQGPSLIEQRAASRLATDPQQRAIVEQRLIATQREREDVARGFEQAETDAFLARQEQKIARAGGGSTLLGTYATGVTSSLDLAFPPFLAARKFLFGDEPPVGGGNAADVLIGSGPSTGGGIEDSTGAVLDRLDRINENTRAGSGNTDNK